MTTTEALKKIIPGKTYPSDVVITEEVEGQTMRVRFCLNSFIVGMYCAVYLNGKFACQTGDHNNKTRVASLKKGIKKALARGATVEIGNIWEVKKSA
jgi:hypothetical protein